MSHMRQLLITAAITVVVCAGIFVARVTKSRQPSDRAADTAPARGKHSPFRSAVVELSFHSTSLHGGEEYLRETGHRTEYIDVAGGRRHEDYERNVTVLRQSSSSEAITFVFDGSNYYVVVDKEGKRTGHVTDMRQGYDYPIWADALIEKIFQGLGQPATAITQEDFLGRPCKVYSSSKGGDTHKWWVWNGITLRSESHDETEDTIIDTVEEALRIEEDANIDPTMFTPPTDVTFERAEETPAQQQGHRQSPPWLRMGPNLYMF